MEDIMKKILFLTVFTAALLAALSLAAQDMKEPERNDTLSSAIIEQYGKDMDKLVVDWSQRIANLIEKYDLVNTKDIRVLPYQSDYDLGDGYIELERHTFIKDAAKRRAAFGYKEIQGILTKRIRIYTDGKSVSKIETDIQEKFFNNRPQNRVIVVDPSPTTEGTDDVTFTHIYKGKTIIENKKLSDIKNKSDSPLRNNIKRDFLVPNLHICYNLLMFIGEAYYSSLKDSEKFMDNFLKDALTDD